MPSTTSSTRIIVRNLPKHLTEARFREHFAKVGSVTDARIAKTKDGRPRMFGFIGFKTSDEAKKAQEYFNRTFIDTSRIEVEVAKPVGDGTLGRPWSRYSKGSSRYQREHPEEKFQNSEDDMQKKRKRDESSEQSEDSEELQRFLSAMNVKSTTSPSNAIQQPKTQKRKVGNDESVAWEDEDGDDDDDDTVEAKDENTSNGTIVETAAVESKKPGGKGVYLQRTHLKFDGEDQSEQPPHQGEVVGVAIKKQEENQDELMEDEIENSDEEDESDDKKKKKESQVLVSAKEREMWEEGRLFVRNLPYLTTEKDLQKLFKRFGQIAEIHIPIDKETKKSKGFAFVLFMNPADAVKAYTALDGTTFQGRLLHILPAKSAPNSAKATALTPGGKKPINFREEVEEKQKSLSQNPFNWNALFIRQDTAVTTMAERLNVEKSELLDHDSSNLAVRMALSEAHVISETKESLKEQGVNVSELERGPSVERSTTTILVKNIPSHTHPNEIQAMFEPHGEVLRVIMPPSCALAIIEMKVPNEARAAFKSLAYRRFRHVPLFLEWAPLNVFTEPAKPKQQPKQEQEQEEKNKKKEKEKQEQQPDFIPLQEKNERQREEKKAEEKKEKEEEEEEEEPKETFAVYVKNLSFATTQEALRAAFEKKCGSSAVIRSVTIPLKKDPTRPNKQLSMGFGFVEYGLKEDAIRAVRLMSGYMLDDHALQVSLSKTAKQPEGSSEADKALARRSASAAVAAIVPKTNKIVVRNVPFEATRKELRELFTPFAQVKSVRLPKRFDGRHRGFAFVEFLTKQEAAAAMEAAKNVHFYGRHLVVEYAANNEPETDDNNQTTTTTTTEKRT